MNRKTENPVALTTTRAEAPPWMRGDQYITTVYRRPLISIYRCVISLLYFHNEWVNVWSHLVPGVAHALLLLRECRQFFMEREGARYLVQMIVWQYIGSCVLCLLVSAGFHTLTAHSQKVATRWLKVDYLGIILNTAAGCTASTYFGLRHHPKLQLCYIASSVIRALILSSVMLAPGADGEAMKIWRAVLFATFFASGFVPMVHACIIDGVDVLGLFPLARAVGMGSFYGVGVVFYMTRFPEKYFPVIFDIWGASHQIFQIMVVMGQMTFINGLRQIAATYGLVSAQIALEYGLGGMNSSLLSAAVCVNDVNSE